MTGNQVEILDGNTFVVSDENGDIEASYDDPGGLFSYDTRFLSTWVLTVNGERLTPLSVNDMQYFETRLFLVPGPGTVYSDAGLSVIRQRSVCNGFHEDLTISNYDGNPPSSSPGSPSPTPLVPGVTLASRHHHAQAPPGPPPRRRAAPVMTSSWPATGSGPATCAGSSNSSAPTPATVPITRTGRPSRPTLTRSPATSTPSTTR
jgi:hypothetical protein